MTEFLSPSHIRVPLQGATKEEVVRELLALIPMADEATRDEVFQAVMNREALMSTGIGNGIAIPHGIVPLSVGLTAALGISARPLDFAAIDGKPVNLVFLLVGEESNPGKNVKALARIARLLHREAFREALAGASSPEAAMGIIEEEEARHRI
jgi:mannitol/fructose-specific phosphotransferase system IIA component (Ntr-type)